MGRVGREYIALRVGWWGMSSVNMDNAHFDITAKGRHAFDRAWALVCEFSTPTHMSVVVPGPKDEPAWSDTKVRHDVAPTLVLFWHEPESWHFGDVTEFKRARHMPATTVLWRWLEDQPDEVFALRLTDTDAWMHRGWRMFCEDWGHVGGSGYAYFALRPTCAWIGK